MLYAKTAAIRRSMAFSFMGLVAPKLKINIQEAYAKKVLDCPRPFTKHLLRTFGDKPLVGAEIGFGFGHNAENILSLLNIKTLYCVDPLLWARTQKYEDTGNIINCYTKPDAAYFERIKQFQSTSKIIFIEKTSDAAFKENKLPNNLNFIYIDGCHSKDVCYRDIVNSIEHVKKGGYVGGHDFGNSQDFGVTDAVFEYTLTSGLHPTITYPDFWFQKEAN